MAADGLTRARTAVRPAVPVLGALAVALQIAYPLASGPARDRLTVGIVAAFAGAIVGHAVLTRGWRRGGGAVAIAAVCGWAAEAAGVHAGVPFGRYAYGDALGARLLGVPVVVVLAWTMLAWPAALVARRLVSARAARIAVGAWALAAWDLFLDPQMVAAGAWHWRDPSPHLPGVPGVPLTNYAGWLLVAAALSAALQWWLGDDPVAGDDTVPLVLYLWTWLGSTVALAAFLHQPAAAAWGGAGMGLVGGPLLRRLRSG